MRRYLRLLFIFIVVVMAISSQAASVEKPKSKPRAAATKTTAKPKSSKVRQKPTPKAKSSSKKPAPSKTAAATKKTPVKAKSENKPAAANVLPRLVDLGATTCVPCKMMEPILEELAKEYKGKLKVEFIDVRQNPAAARKYGIRVIPTQIFFDRKGEEFFRHEGFYSKEDILRKFKDQGIDLDK